MSANARSQPRAEPSAQPSALSDADRAALRQRLQGLIAQRRGARTRQTLQAQQPAVPARVDLATAIEHADGDAPTARKTHRQSLKEQRKRARKTLLKIIDQLSGEHDELRNMLLRRVHAAETVDTRDLQNITAKYMAELAKKTAGLSLGGRHAPEDDGDEHVVYEEARPQEFLVDADGERLMPEATV